jgi:hypothetical protein
MLYSTPLSRALLAAVLLAASASVVAGQAATGKSLPIAAGMVFNMANPLQGIESYQGGLGAKLKLGNHALRMTLETTYNSSSGSLALNLGGVYEYHFLPGPISPYVGGSFAIGYARQGSTSSMVPLSFGGIAGAEIYILDFLSVFAEYTLSVGYTSVTDTAAATTTGNWSITTGLGNDAMIGVTVYFPPNGKRF